MEGGSGWDGALQEDDGDHDCVEHGFGREPVLLLDVPEGVDAYCLGGDADEEEVGQG